MLDLGNEVNAMILAFTLKLGFRTCHTNVGAQKIDGSTLQMFRMVLVSFQVEDKLDWAWFFQELFLLTNTTLKMVLGMLFLNLSNADIQFTQNELI